MEENVDILRCLVMQIIQNRYHRPFGGTNPSSTTVGVSSANATNGYILSCYCWHGVQGFSKFGNYNANANGTFYKFRFYTTNSLVKRIWFR